MKIIITAIVQDEDADPGDRTGVTNAFYERLTDFNQGLPALFGLDDIDIKRAPEETP